MGTPALPRMLRASRSSCCKSSTCWRLSTSSAQSLSTSFRERGQPFAQKELLCDYNNAMRTAEASADQRPGMPTIIKNSLRHSASLHLPSTSLATSEITRVPWQDSPRPWSRKKLPDFAMSAEVTKRKFSHPVTGDSTLTSHLPQAPKDPSIPHHVSMDTDNTALIHPTDQDTMTFASTTTPRRT
jgi:hypothetical protein